MHHYKLIAYSKTSSGETPLSSYTDYTDNSNGPDNQSPVEKTLGNKNLLQLILGFLDLHRDNALLQIILVNKMFFEAATAQQPTAFTLTSAVRVTGLHFDRFTAAFTGLKHLKLDGCLELTAGEFSGNLSRLQHLESIDLSNNSPLADDFLTALTKLPELTSLSLRNIPAITSNGIITIGALTNLTELDLSGTPIVGMGWLTLRNLTRLTHLSVRDCGLDDHNLNNLCNALPELNMIDIRGNMLLNSQAILDAYPRINAIRDFFYSAFSLTSFTLLKGAFSILSA